MPILGSSASQSGRTSDAPTITGVTAGSGSVSVAFTEPAYRGKGSVTYTATSTPSGITGTGSSPITVSGLTNGTSYTFTITALSSSGVSTLSSASSNVTPDIPQAGFILGGQNGAGQATSSIVKFAFTEETASILGATLNTTYQVSAGFANSGTAGYISGGFAFIDYEQVVTNFIQKLTFSTDVRTTLANSLSSSRTYHSGLSNSGTAGYWSGGGPSTSTTFSSIERLTFSNEIVSVIAANLTTLLRINSAALANSGTAGYISSGNRFYVTGTKSTTIDKLTFSNETTSVLSDSNSIKAVGFHFAFSNSGTAGYFGGGKDNNGSSTSYLNDIRKLQFSTDTVSFTAATLMRDSASGFAKSGTAGYIAGGYNNDTENVFSGFRKFSFSTETIVVNSSALSTNMQSSGHFANSGTL